MNAIKLAALAAILSTSAVFADQPAANAQSAATPSAATLPDFRSLDLNGDGVLSKEEAKQSTDLTSAWTTYDADKNGTLSRAEYMKAQEGLKKSPAKY